MTPVKTMQKARVPRTQLYAWKLLEEMSLTSAQMGVSS